MSPMTDNVYCPLHGHKILFCNNIFFTYTDTLLIGVGVSVGLLVLAVVIVATAVTGYCCHCHYRQVKQTYVIECKFNYL